MPIEDIDFLGENSEVDSTLFFLDSDSRDQTAYPSPAEYVIQFTEPIKLVIGVDILDATIPAAMYIIDDHCHTLSVTILVAPLDNGNGVEAKLKLQSLRLNNDEFQSIMSAADMPIVYCFVVDGIHQEAIHQASMISMASMYGKQCPFNVFITSEGTSWPSYPFASAADMESLPANITRQLTVRKASLVLQNGNYDIISLMVMLSATLKSVATNPSTTVDTNFALFEVVSNTTDTVALQGRYAFVNTTPFMMDMTKSLSSVAGVLGFSSAPSMDASINGRGYEKMWEGCFGSVDSKTVTSNILSNAVYMATSVQIIVAPGIANLLGVRYITLRCPEIEQHMYSGMTYGDHSTGLGVFKLPSGSEVANLRFDFVSLVRRPFHPIGRLSRLTLRFERNNGVLYDFKGINTQLLLAVKFLSPGKRIPLTRSVLNPDYDPNYLRYTLRMSATEAVESIESNELGILPVVPACPLPLQDHDIEPDDKRGEHAGQTGESNEHMFQKRQEIARRLLQQQDKYDYPARSEDALAWRSC